MYERERVNTGNYISMRRLYDAYESCNGMFGCKISYLKLVKVSKIFDKWEVHVGYTFKDNKQRDKFDYEVSMAYDFLWNRPHAVLYYLKK